MQEKEVVRRLAGKILQGREAYPFGICRFADLPPLLECRAKQRLPENAQSVLVCLFPYYTGEHPERNISRYAMVTDYHLIAGKYLQRFCEALRQQFPNNRFEPFTDNSPVPEVRSALLAGWAGGERTACCSIRITAAMSLSERWLRPCAGAGCTPLSIRLPQLRPLPASLPAGGAAAGRQRRAVPLPLPHHPEKGRADRVGNPADTGGRAHLGLRHLQRRLPLQPGAEDKPGAGISGIGRGGVRPGAGGEAA